MEQALVNKFIDFMFTHPVPLVYFIRCGDFIKIGRSDSMQLSNRLSSLQIGNPYNLHIEAMVPGGKELEYQLHQILKKRKRHTRGEWYKLSKKQVDDIFKVILITGKEQQ